MYCTVLTLVFSIVGLNTSDSTPSATVNHAFDAVLRGRAETVFAGGVQVGLGARATRSGAARRGGQAGAPRLRVAKASDEATTATALTVTT